jgi:phage gpG-like protein
MEKAAAALAQYGVSLQDKRELLATLGAGQLVSIRRTFIEEGSPSGSWVPLAPSTLKSKKYTAGHKLLIRRGNLLNSINAQTQGNTVVIGTNLVYAAVHQFGSRDRGGAIGPQARIAGREVEVKGHEYGGHLGKRGIKIINNLGHEQMVMRRTVGPANLVKVGAHTRFQNIPARPYLVFRPEDRARMDEIVRRFIIVKAKQSGLETK